MMVRYGHRSGSDVWWLVVAAGEDGWAGVFVSLLLSE